MTKKKILLMEYIWLFLTVLLTVMFIYQTFTIGFSQSYLTLILAAASGLMYLWRHNLRKKEEEKEINK